MTAQAPIWLQTTEVALNALAASSWPIAFGVVAVLFRQPIKDLLTRMRRLNSFGSEAEFIPIEGTAQHAERANGGKLSVPGNLPQLPPPDAVYDLFDQYARKTLDTEVLGDTDRQLAWAIRMRSISEANRIHEFNYRLIFGSQIAALKALNTVTEAKAEDFRAYFDAAASNPEWKVIHEGRTFEQWGQFLVDASYVQLVEGTDPEVVRITPFGRQFLIWMTEARVSEVKVG